MRFLSCLAGAVLKHGLPALAGVVPFDEVALDVAAAAWEAYGERRREEGSQASPDPAAMEAILTTEVSALAQAPALAVQEAVARAIQDVAAEQAPPVQKALTAYLTQVPAMVRRLLRFHSVPGERRAEMAVSRRSLMTVDNISVRNLVSAFPSESAGRFLLPRAIS